MKGWKQPLIVSHCRQDRTRNSGISMSESLLKPNERVLSTLNDDGTRRWLKPRLSPGRFWMRRRLVAYLLIALYSLLPFIKINDKPAILLDIMHREFTFFGKTFLSHDTLLFGLFMIMVFFTIFLVTALFGRIWCGWMCPQTVYLEFLYRPIERLFEGAPGKKKPKKHLGLRRFLKYAVYLIISLHLAQTFLSYFVGTSVVHAWIFGSPLDHPVAFILVIGTTGLMLFDFGIFREQVCCVICPYARLQGALTDQDSLIITYDKERGEPRGRKTKKKSADTSLPVLGDCIDCTMCVQTCPTGIDIRMGSQLECIGCAQCIDACDVVMDKIDRPRGLIRYSSENAVEHKAQHFLRPRVVIYPLILLLVFAGFIVVLVSKNHANIWLGREAGLPFYTLPTGEITNQLRTRITNRNAISTTYTITVIEPEGVTISGGSATLTVKPGKEASEKFVVIAQPEVFTTSQIEIVIRITDHNEFTKDTIFEMKGHKYKALPETTDD
ncbi:MAG: cytochrome c oxidase accessory protein CcoG [Phycisphaerales bacterium]|nr:cytochrome c oxidase accessory protein CcoG [Phycisphaerales bacterium]